MRILSTTFNLLANAESKLKFLPAKFRSTSFRRFSDSPALSPNDDKNKNLMLMVRYMINETTCDYCTLSTEHNSFPVVQHNLPKSSILRAENYYPKFRNADYIIRACSNYKWMLLTCQKLPGPPYELLWDPKTNEMKPLPPSPFGPPLPFPRLIYTFGFGVGFDPHTAEDYKVVKCHAFEYDGFYRVQSEVYSLRTNSWKEITYLHDYPFTVIESLSLHIEGFYYWIAYNATAQTCVVIQFDFAKEKFLPVLIPMPRSEKLANVNNVVLAEFRGSLAAVVFDFDLEMKKSDDDVSVDKKKPCFEIWVWGNDDGWSRVDKFYLSVDVGSLVRLLGLYKNDKALIEDSEGELLLYDCETGLLQNLNINDEAWHMQDEAWNMKVFPFGNSPPFP